MKKASNVPPIKFHCPRCHGGKIGVGPGVLNEYCEKHSVLNAIDRVAVGVFTDPLLKQVGGDHYAKMKIQPWELIEKNGYDFFEGSALSYIMRWKEKGGVQDLDKAIHYLEQIQALAARGQYGEKFKKEAK